MMGMVDYMAPEQTGDSKDVDIRADIYSLGATLFKLLTDQAPYADAQYNTVIKKLKAMATEPIPAIGTLRADVPDELAAILEKMLAKDADDRFSTPQEVAEALSGLAEGADLAALSARYHETTHSDRDTTPDDEPSRRGTEEHLSSSMTETWTEKSESGFKTGVREGEAPAEPSSSAVSARREPRPPGVEITAGAPAWWNRNTKIAAILLGLAGLFAGAMVIRLATDKGEIKITAYDPEIEVTIKRNKQSIDQFQIKQRPDATSYYSGDYEIEIAGGTPDGVKIKNKTFQLTRGKDVLVEIVHVAAVRPSVDDVARSGDRPQHASEVRPQQEPVVAGSPDPATGEPWSLGSAEDVLPGLIPRPAKLQGIRRWQVQTHRPTTAIAMIAWSAKGLLACVTHSGEVRILDAKSLKLKAVLPTNGQFYHCVAAWNPEGNRLALQCIDSIRIWNIERGWENAIAVDGPCRSRSLPWSPDGQKLAFSKTPTSISIVDRDGSETPLAEGISMHPTQIAWSPVGDLIAAADGTGKVSIWNLDGEEIATIEDAGYYSLLWHPNGKTLLTDNGAAIRLWSLEGELVAEHAQRDATYSVAIAPRGSFIAIGVLQAK